MRPFLKVVEGGSQTPSKSVGAMAVGTEPCDATKSIGPAMLSPIRVNPAGLSISAAHVALGAA